jgi:hypothetical protein
MKPLWPERRRMRLIWNINLASFAVASKMMQHLAARYPMAVP